MNKCMWCHDPQHKNDNERKSVVIKAAALSMNEVWFLNISPWQDMAVHHKVKNLYMNIVTQSMM